MPTGIIMQSSSHGATPEAIEKVFTDNGLEPDKPAAAEAEAAVEPKREDFESDDAFTTAQEEFTQKAEDAAEAEEKKREEEEEKTRPKLSRKQRAIARETKKLQDDLKAANDRIAALEGKAPRTEAPKAPAAPKREEFKTDAEYDEAMFDYRYKLRRAKEAVESAQERTTAQLKENFQNYQSSVDDFKEEHDDWDDVVNQSLPIHESVYLAVMELENGPAVTYYLGKHPEFARKLAEMTPLSAAMEVGRLSTRLKTGAPEPSAAGNGAKPKPKTRLPEPVKPVSTAATSSTLTSAEAAKKGNYRAFKTAQRAGR